MPIVQVGEQQYKFPDSMSQDEIKGVMQSKFPPKTKEQIKTQDSYGLNLFREGLQGVSLNTSDEIGAAIAAGMATIKDGAKFKDAYNDIIGSIQSEQTAFRQENPKSALAAQVAGGIAAGGTGLAKVAAKTAGKGLAPRILANTGVGAIEGGVAGYAGAEGEDRLDSGAKGAVLGGAVGAAGGEAIRYFANKSALKSEVSKLLQSGSTDKKIARYMLDGASKVKKDRVAIEAVNQGFDEGMVAAIKGSSRADRANMRKMLSIVESGKHNARANATDRATDVIGQSLSGRIGLVHKVNRHSGSKIDGIAKGLKGQQADFTQAVNSFLDDLDNIGVQVSRDPDGIIRPKFSGADIEDVTASENILRRVVNRMQKGNVDAYEAHRLKRFIDENVSFSKKGEGLTGKTELILKSLRRNLDQALDNQFPAYKKVNDVYSDTKGVLDAIQDVAGKKIDVTGRNADKALGTLSRSLLSNIRSRANLINSLDDLESAAKRYGGRFDDDIVTQVLFADEMDKVFGVAAKTSLQGDVGKAVRSGVQAAKGSFTEMASDAAIKGIHKMRGINEENAFKALKKLLEDQPGKAIGR